MKDIVFAIGALVCLVLAVAVSGMVFSFHESDAAGQGMTKGFSVVAAIAFWVAIGVVALMAVAKGGFPGYLAPVAGIALLAAAAGTFSALVVLQDMERDAPYERLFQVCVVVPCFLALALCVWAYFLRASSGVFIAVPLAAVAAVPLVLYGRVPAGVQARKAAFHRSYGEAVVRKDAFVAEIKALPDDTPAARLLPYTEIAPEKISAPPQPPFPGLVSEVRQAAINRMSKLPRRQPDLEVSLNQGEYGILTFLGDLDLQYSAAICSGGRKCARRFIDGLKPPTPAPPFDAIQDRSSLYFAGMRWLAQHGCDLKTEFADLDRTVRLYPETSPRTWFLDYVASVKSDLKW